MSNSWSRPKIDIPKTRSEWTWDIIGYTFYFGSIIFLLCVWDKLPVEVPAHFNAQGEVDRFGSKWELLLLPAIGAFILIFMQLLEKFPELHNYPKRLNESNVKQFYLNSRKIVNQLKNSCVIVFSLLACESALLAWSGEQGMGLWMLPFALLMICIPIVVGVIKQRKIR